VYRAPAAVRNHEYDIHIAAPSGNGKSFCSAARPFVRSPTVSARFAPDRAAAKISAAPAVPKSVSSATGSVSAPSPVPR